MNVLVLPDIHSRVFWREAINKYSKDVDKVIFLGDYIDPYYDELKGNPDSMECDDFYDVDSNLMMLDDIVSLKKKEPLKYILLTGNHTDSYIWSDFSAAKRTDEQNWNTYHKFFTKNLIYFNLVYVIDNVIFSHAGITKEWLSYINLLPDDIMTAAKTLMDTDLSDFNPNIISTIGWFRGGYGAGSCEWADIREHIEKVIDPILNEFIGKGYDGVFQVFGHTQLKAPLICDKWACLDCRKAFIVNTETHECKDCI